MAGSTYIGNYNYKVERKGYITVLLLALALFCHGQQQTLYTNYLMNQYLYNPAYAGVEDGTQFNLGYRNQWFGFDGAPKSYIVNGYGKLKKKPNMTVGGLIMSERMGLLQRTSFYGTYSYHLKINKKADINFGLGIGGIQHKVRVYDAKPYDKDDSFLGSDVLGAFAFDANAGFYFYTKNFFLGFSLQQMPGAKIRWDNSNGKNTNHFYAYTGYNFHLNKEWVLQPSLFLRSNSPAPYQLEFNGRVIYDEMIWLGMGYRQNSSTCFMLGCKIDKQFTFAYSYDLTMTAMKKYSSGTHEIVLSYLIPFKKKKSKSELIQDADEEELNKIDNSLKTNLRNKKKKNENEGEKEKEKTEAQPKTEDAQPEKTQEPVNPGNNGMQESKPVETQPEVKQPETTENQAPQAEPAAPATEQPKATEGQQEVKPQSETNTKEPEPKNK